MRSSSRLSLSWSRCPRHAEQFPLPPAGSDVIGETVTAAAGSRGHAARPRAPLRPRLRGNHQREPGRRPLAARRGHRGGRAEAAPAAARAAHRDRDQPAGAPPVLVSAGGGRRGAGRVDLPGQHREDGLEHAARHARRSCPRPRTLPGYRRNRFARSMRSAASRFRRSFRAVRTIRWGATRWGSEFRAAPT